MLFRASPSTEQFAGQHRQYVISMRSRLRHLRHGNFCSLLIRTACSTDDFTVGVLLLLLSIFTAVAAGQSFPRSWTFVAPDSTALVGIEWQHLRDSFLA